MTARSYLRQSKPSYDYDSEPEPEEEELEDDGDDDSFLWDYFLCFFSYLDGLC